MERTTAAAASGNDAGGDEVYTDTVLVTPAIAKQWLTLNVVNRPVSMRNVAAIAWDIEHGKWRLTHQGIAFNRELELIDGQHRLHAVVAAGVGVHMRVSYNVDADYYAPIDTGRARTVAHVLNLSSRVVAVCSGIALLESGAGARATSSQVEEIYEAHRRGIDWVVAAMPPKRGLTANVLAAHAYAYPVAPDRVDDFARKLVSNTGMESASGVLALYRHLQRLGGFASAARLDVTLATLRCLQAHCEGKHLEKVHTCELGLRYFAQRRASMGL